MEESRKISVGNIVYLGFFDHAENRHDDSLWTAVYGRVSKVTPEEIEVVAWDTPDDPDDTESQDRYRVIRSSITDSRVFRKTPPRRPT